MSETDLTPEEARLVAQQAKERAERGMNVGFGLMFVGANGVGAMGGYANNCTLVGLGWSLVITTCALGMVIVLKNAKFP